MTELDDERDDAWWYGESDSAPHEFAPGDFGMFCDACGRLRVAHDQQEVSA